MGNAFKRKLFLIIINNNCSLIENDGREKVSNYSMAQVWKIWRPGKITYIVMLDSGFPIQVVFEGSPQGIRMQVALQLPNARAFLFNNCMY